jgi:type II secretory pathway pseudopilin PulG
MKHPDPDRPPRTGFALVVTVSLLVLLSVIALGFLSLSTVTLRSSTQEQAQMEARANARLALQIAIGELQKHVGPDTRITAPADILTPENPPLTGVWRSWEGSDHEVSGILAGRPIQPQYDAKKRNTAENGRFLAWLVSSTYPVTRPGDAATLVSSIGTDGTIPLVSTGSLAKGANRQVHVAPVPVNDGTYAWWVSGENQKAHLPKLYRPELDTASNWADHTRSHAVADPEVFELDSLLTDPSPAHKSFTRNTADLFAKKGATIRPSQSFHDLSATSVGLLTNTATGGWRKDFSLLTENWDAQPTSGLEFFQITPTQHLPYKRPANDTDFRPANSMLYHWSDHRTATREFWGERGPIASWARIRTYATLYKDMTSSTTAAPNINHRSWVDNGHADVPRTNPAVLRNGYNIFHNIRLMPQMARIQFIVSHYATTVGATAGNYRPAVLYTPVVTLWNPYNTRLTLTGRLIINPSYTLPLALRHQLAGDGVPNLTAEYWAVQGRSTLNISAANFNYQNKALGPDLAIQNFHLNINPSPNPANIILEPGETRIFSPSAVTPADATGSGTATFNLAPGVRTGGGIFYSLDRRITGAYVPTNRVSLPGSVRMNVDAKFDVATLMNYSGRPACGTAYQWFIDSAGSGRSHSWYQIAYDTADADNLYLPKAGLAAATLAECASKPVPFLSMILGSRIANHKATATKGLVQAEPIVDFFSPSVSLRWTDVYPGNANLLNCPWDFSVVEHSSGGDDMLPNVDNTTNSSYIVTGVRKADGVSRIVAAELPTRPLVSLADLTHMQIRGLNPTPPYSGNVVANSDASPLIPRDNIVNPANTRANARNNEQQDDSYCANHVLFDDWFFSSIAPKPAGFGPSGGTDLRQTYLDFLTGKETLFNQAYHPIPEDRVPDDTAAAGKFTEHVEPTESWKTISSRLEVEGMFNVNSTSVRAWRALLGHARNQKIPYFQPGGAIGLSGPTNYAFSRTSVAGDLAAGEAPQVAGEYADTTEFTGHRVFTDDMLDRLAENIVGQVRVRGPFLSLSEFVNRQLSTDNNLALAGAIQTALNQLTTDRSLNPFQIIQDESVPSAADPPGPHGYVFPEAAVGHNTYGLPGWTRQADILRPLAPILTTRDDTFTIRAYGDARSPDGRILARAWCEATVRRTRDFVDSADSPDITSQPTVLANQTFGRRFVVLSFRWLSADEV